MPKECDRMFEVFRMMKQLNLAERLFLIPQSEIVIMKAVLDAAEKNAALRPTVSEVARYLEISPPAISRTLRRLREKGYVDCLMDAPDRRNTYLAVTPAGKAALDADMQKITLFMRRALCRMPPEDLDQFYLLFNRIFNCVKEEMENSFG